MARRNGWIEGMITRLAGWGERLAARPAWLMLLTLAAAAALRLALLGARWINADEGAHLLDGRFVLEGLQPVIDYASRQPFYTYILALFLKIFGVSLTAGRLMPLLASLGVGWLIWLMARALYDPLRAWLAAALYLFLPLSLIWSTVVKTELLAMLLCALSAWLLLRARRDPGLWTLYILSGIFAALAYYVRQSTLYLPLATALFLLLTPGERLMRRWRLLGLYAAGYFGLCLLAAWYYWAPLGGRELLFSQINPFNIVWNRLAHTLGILPPDQRVADSSGFRILDQDPVYTIVAWRDSLLFSLFILAAALGSLWRGRGRVADREPFRRFLWLWLVILVLAYLFQSASRGFYTQYFLEALLPLLLLAPGLLPAETMPVRLLRRFGAGAVLYGMIFLLFRLIWTWQISWKVQLLLGMGLGLLWAVWRAQRQTRGGQDGANQPPLEAGSPARAGWHSRLLANAGMALLAAAFFISASWSGSLITPRYECTWSPATLAQVEAALRRDSKPGDTVLSGGMIWTYAAEMQPFAGITHPTIFFMKYDARFKERFESEPPVWIIIDGYTQKKFKHYWPFLEETLRNRYYLEQKFTGSGKPVELWRLQESPEPQALPAADSHAGDQAVLRAMAAGVRPAAALAVQPARLAAVLRVEPALVRADRAGVRRESEGRR